MIAHIIMYSNSGVNNVSKYAACLHEGADVLFEAQQPINIKDSDSILQLFNCAS
jgi:hypothetical protein